MPGRWSLPQTLASVGALLLIAFAALYLIHHFLRR